MLLRDLTDGQAVDQVVLIADAEVRSKRGGGSYLRLALGDRTGRVTAMLWDDHERLVEHLVPGQPVRVRGTFTRHPRYGPQIDGPSFSRPVEGSFDEADLLDGPPRPASTMEADLRALVATIQDPFLRDLLDHVLGPHAATWEAYRDAPAAKRFHQAYAHGLLEHCLTVAEGVSAMSATFPGIDRDVAVTGALLHDIGKLEAYASTDGAIDMTDAGKLEGEIPLGYYRIRRAIEDMPGFPADTAQAVLHIILAHHGSLEHGSPVVPCTREATLVHFVDNLGGRLGSFDRLEKELPTGSTWSTFDRGIGGSAFFGGRTGAGRDDHAQRAPADADRVTTEPHHGAREDDDVAAVVPPEVAPAAHAPVAAPASAEHTTSPDADAPSAEPEPLSLELDVA